MGELIFVPSTPIWANMGKPDRPWQPSACFVLAVEDSLQSMYETLLSTAMVFKSGGGVGYNFSTIRPRGSLVRSTKGKASGVVELIKLYNASSNMVMQGGVRRGASIGILNVDHPEIVDFINAKLHGDLTNFNLSVGITDAFMEALEQGAEWPLSFNGQVHETVPAPELWEFIVKAAHACGDPGIIFVDRLQKHNPVPKMAINSTNPCGEIPLCPYDSCRLLAINLYSYVNKPFTTEASFDYELFKKHVALAQRIMDDIIDLEMEKIDRILEKIDSDPEDPEIKRAERILWEKIKAKTAQGRRTGVGTTAEGDMLAALNLRYGTEEASDFSEKIHRLVAIEAYRSSINLAKERGAFSIYNYEREENNPYIKRLFNEAPELKEDMKTYGRRNIACLTIAPTGTTSLMTQTTSGVEPAFSLIYKRRRKINPNDPGARVDFKDENGDCFEEYIVFHHKFVTWMEAQGYPTAKNYTQEELDEMIAKSPYYKATSKDVDWMQKVKMQGRIQKWVDHSISVTINLPADVSEELVNQLYIEAWRSGCKGCTVYRDGSRSGVLLDASEKKDKGRVICFPELTPKRPRELVADVLRFQNNKEKWIAFIGMQNGRPYEIFTGIEDDDEGIALPKNVTKGKIIKNFDDHGVKRYDFQFSNRRGYKTTVEGLSDKFNPEYWNYAKLISGVLRYGMPIDQVIKLVGSLELDSKSINTWKNGVERALKNYLPDGSEVQGEKCPKCGNTLVYQEKCAHCVNCDFSRCA